MRSITHVLSSGIGMVVLLAVVPASALDPAYLAAWPTVEQVMRDQTSDEEGDTLARQMAALNTLNKAIEELAGPRRWHGLTADEARIRGRYAEAVARIRATAHERYSNELPPGIRWPWTESPLQRWYALEWRYESDADTRAETLRRYLEPASLAALAIARRPPDGDAGGFVPSDGQGPLHRVPDRVLDIVGLAVIAAVGLALMYGLTRLLRGLRMRRQDRTASARSDFGSVLDLVLDTVEPYLTAAASAQGGRIDGHKLMEPYAIGFLHGYCWAAFRILEPQSASYENVGRAVLAMLRAPRLLRYFVRDAQPSGTARDWNARSTDRDFIRGTGYAMMVLELFADRRSAATEALLAKDPHLSIPAAPATKLHPEGPGSDDGRRLMTKLFADRFLV